jgi:hypothetical protein
MTPPVKAFSERLEELVETLEAFEPPTDTAAYVTRDLFEHLHKAQRLAEHLEHDGYLMPLPSEPGAGEDPSVKR